MFFQIMDKFLLADTDLVRLRFHQIYPYILIEFQRQGDYAGSLVDRYGIFHDNRDILSGFDRVEQASTVKDIGNVLFIVQAQNIQPVGSVKILISNNVLVLKMQIGYGIQLRKWVGCTHDHFQRNVEPKRYQIHIISVGGKPVERLAALEAVEDSHPVSLFHHILQHLDQSGLLEDIPAALRRILIQELNKGLHK